MADHYRTLAQSLVSLGFLFRRQGERHWEVWRNRQTDQEVTFDRDEVSKSRAAVDAVLAAAQAGPSKASRKPETAAAAKAAPRKSAPSPKPTAKTPRTRTTARKGAGRPAPRKGKR